MSTPLNIFAERVSDALATLLRSKLTASGSTAVVSKSESVDIDVNPRVVVCPVEIEEIIYQTGVSRLVMELTAKVNVDEGGANVITNTNSSQALFGYITDLIQQEDLIYQMNTTGNLVVDGVVIGSARLNEIVDRQWSKTLTVEFFGFAKS
jgi:hypothetical protein